MDRFNTDPYYNRPIVVPIAPLIVAPIIVPITIKPVHYSPSYQQAIYQKDGRRGFNRPVGMGL